MPTTNTSLDELGPVDYVVVEFPAGAQNFTGEMAADPRARRGLRWEESRSRLAQNTCSDEFPTIRLGFQASFEGSKCDRETAIRTRSPTDLLPAPNTHVSRLLLVF